MSDNYYRRLRTRSWLETKAVWTSYRWWLILAPPVAFTLLLFARKGWNGILNALDVLINAVAGVALAFFGTAVISAFRSIRLLDDEQQSARRNTEATLSAAENELAAERGKNQKPEIRIEILEGFFNPGAYEGAGPNAENTGWGPTRSEFLITLHLRLVNRRPQRTSMTKCELFIESEAVLIPLTAVPVVLPHPHAIERDTIFHRGRGVERTTINDIQDLNTAIPLEYGVAVDGLVQFIIPELEVSKRENDAFQDEAKFTVRVTDSFIQTHEVIRAPEPWPKKGRLVPAP